MKPQRWKPSPEMDGAVRAWMRDQGLPAESTRYYAHEEVYAWRHGAPEGSPTLWIARPVLEDHDPVALVAALDRLEVARRMRGTPKARFLVVDEDRELCVMPWPTGPYRGE